MRKEIFEGIFLEIFSEILENFNEIVIFFQKNFLKNAAKKA
jgi:hypothetical protein